MNKYPGGFSSNRCLPDHLPAHHMVSPVVVLPSSCL